MTEEKYEIVISINIDCQCKMIDKWHDCNYAHMHTLSVSGNKKPLISSESWLFTGTHKLYIQFGHI